MSHDPFAGADDLHLPPGRTRLTWDEARHHLVDHPRFADSSTRATLWGQLELYVARFLALEEKYQELLDDDPLVHYVWLGGSFASLELEPRNIDLTICVDAVGRAALRGQPGAGWLNEAFQRDRILERFKISPLQLRYRRIASVFRLDRLNREDLEYLQERGQWDDWWQRCRDLEADSGEPTLATAPARRGYLEVTL